MNVPLSACCQAAINRNKSCDKCSSCSKSITYALVGTWASRFNESYGVCQLHNGEYYYFWQSVSNWDEVEKHLSYETYVGQILELWSVTAELNKEAANIDFKDHKSFSDRWKDKVKNPEYAL
jgi:RecJ-like exonuclease